MHIYFHVIFSGAFPSYLRKPGKWLDAICYASSTALIFLIAEVFKTSPNVLPSFTYKAVFCNANLICINKLASNLNLPFFM